MSLTSQLHERAALRNHEGMTLEDAARFTEALAAYRSAAELDPTWAIPWFNIGLLHKNRSEWVESFRANREALLRDEGHQGALWNLGIAATALGDWATARDAWRRCGIELPAGVGPIEYQIGLTPIRVDPRRNGEVVWADRIDPARAVIRSVPLPDCGRRYGDIVLHDGAPNGYRLLHNRQVPVFDELEVLQPSPYATYELAVHGVSRDELDTLEANARARDVHVENWSGNVRRLCRACSEGLPIDGPGHDHGPEQDHEGGFRIGIASRREAEALDVLATWASARRSADLGKLVCLLPSGAVH